MSTAYKRTNESLAVTTAAGARAQLHRRFVCTASEALLVAS